MRLDIELSQYFHADRKASCPKKCVAIRPTTSDHNGVGTIMHHISYSKDSVFVRMIIIPGPGFLSTSPDSSSNIVTIFEPSSSCKIYSTFLAPRHLCLRG